MIKSDQTKQFLLLVSSHLSYRKECRCVEYKVEVAKILDHIYIRISPDVYVYPDVHHKKLSDRCALVDHICMYHMEGHITDIIPGIYKYQLSVKHKQRKWMRCKGGQYEA